MEAALQAALHGEQRTVRASEYLEMNTVYVVFYLMSFLKGSHYKRW